VSAGGPRRWRRVAAAAGVALAGAVLLLFLPEGDPPLPPPADPALVRPFAWRQDAFWERLEADYVRARAAGCDGVASQAKAALAALAAGVEALGQAPLPPDAPLLGEVERRAFDAAALAAACPGLLPETARLVARLREAVKRQSEGWPPGERRTREALYRTLYGSRAALEEAMLQLPVAAAPPSLAPGIPEPSATPAATLFGVTLHSGDVLLSRGGAALSSFIARGNDFPGNYSHVALVHVDEGTRRVRIVEAHIERGVAVATPEEYLRDRKLRVMVLRPRADLPALAQDPMLPHRAAAAGLGRAASGSASGRPPPTSPRPGCGGGWRPWGSATSRRSSRRTSSTTRSSAWWPSGATSRRSGATTSTMPSPTPCSPRPTRGRRCRTRAGSSRSRGSPRPTARCSSRSAGSGRCRRG
jgi:hypothetical protein